MQTASPFFHNTAGLIVGGNRTSRYILPSVTVHEITEDSELRYIVVGIVRMKEFVTSKML